MEGLADFSFDGDTLKVIGEIDVSNASELSKALAMFNGHLIRIDLSDVTFIDSSGVRALVEPTRQDKTVSVINAHERVEGVLRLLGLAQILGLPERSMPARRRRYE